MSQLDHMIPHNKPCITGEELRNLRSVMDRKWLVGGPETKKLERTVKKLIGVKYALAVNSGLSALHLSLISLGLGKGDQVIIPTYTCVALLNAVNYINAVPVLVDTVEDSFNIDPEKASELCSKQTKAIIVPHTFGFPAEIDRILNLNIPVIEDCAQAIGTKYLSKPVGSFGDISIFSFYATKVVTTGQGGMMMTNNRRYHLAASESVHPGIRKSYRIRYNYGMTDTAAAIGNAQFRKLQSFLARRKIIASRYQRLLRGKSSVSFSPQVNETQVNHFRFILRFHDRDARDAIRKDLEKNKITAIPPISQYELLHRQLRLPARHFPNAEKLVNTTLSLPIYPCLTDDEIEKIVRVLDALLT